jgi:hypothetical protein
MVWLLVEPPNSAASVQGLLQTSHANALLNLSNGGQRCIPVEGLRLRVTSYAGIQATENVLGFRDAGI